MISVDEAQSLCLDGLGVLGTEEIALADANRRTMLSVAHASRHQPPFAASAMDGYAVDADGAVAGAVFDVVGEAAAGHAWDGVLGAGKALRIFTGAPIPDGASRVIIQEDVTREGDQITLSDNLDEGPYIRPAGADFPAGFWKYRKKSESGESTIVVPDSFSAAL